MIYDNDADRLRKDVLIRVAKAFYGEQPEDDLNRIPIRMRPKDSDPSRCCIYRDRQVIKHRAMAALGYGLQDEADELTSLGTYYQQALEREKPEAEGLSVLDIACSACIQSRYVATEACRGCIAHPCKVNCPKDAISIINGRSHIDPALCVNCGLCLKMCPYHAIIRIPIPCEEACPVGAISKDASGREVIDHEKCIYCGKCAQACPFGAVVEKSQMIDVLCRLREKRPVVLLIAPSVAGQYPGTREQLVSALQQLGFARGGGGGAGRCAHGAAGGGRVAGADGGWCGFYDHVLLSGLRGDREAACA